MYKIFAGSVVAFGKAIPPKVEKKKTPASLPNVRSQLQAVQAFKSKRNYGSQQLYPG